MADITIIMPSYNKEKYINEALDSVFMQETTYDYHIIVADDCSSDKTVEIVKQYQQKYPDKITLLESETNQRLYKNVLRAYEITKTDYFCVLDPDDFWTDKYKIQKSLDFLEEHKDYTIYVTNTVVQTPDNKTSLLYKMNKKSDSDFNDFLSDKAVLGCTLGSMYRNVVFKNGLPEKMKNLEYPTMEQSFRGDTFRNILHLHEGKAHCEPEADATYRITEEGLWQGINNFRRNLLNANIYKDLWIFFDKKYPEILYKSFKIFNIIKKDDEFINKLESIEDENKRSAIIKQLSELESIYNKNKEEIKASMKQSIKKLKYKIYFNIYEKIQSKLTKKGIL